MLLFPFRLGSAGGGKAKHMARITIIQGHPDSGRVHFCHSLAQTYAKAAMQAGHEIRLLDVASLTFPQLRSAEEFHAGMLAPDIALAQQALVWAQHLLLVYPLWYGFPPARLHAFLEQIFRPGVAGARCGAGFPQGRLHGRTARLVVTMAMPGFVYRLSGALSARALRRHLLGGSGIKPVRMDFIGHCGAGEEEDEAAALPPPMPGPVPGAGWLARMRRLGARAA